ncbi:hypothetical protein GGR54DRAFT_596846 [Hypoxylon sp. NC1633]|nr:hypothetical protein GGR54DRAFT_596846 [Hypoxylon sp. NC1633]
MIAYHMFKPVRTDVQRRDNSSACQISEVFSASSSTSALASPTSTLTTTPTTTPTPTVIPTTTTPMAPSSTGLLVKCYSSLMLSCYNVVPPDTAHSMSDKFCSDFGSITGFSGPNWPAIQYALNEFSALISYNWRVSWKSGCVANGQDTWNVGQPIPGFTCQQAMRMAFDGCVKTGKGGRGGRVVVGCLVFDFSPVNLGGGSCSLPFQ